jgi:hypothetical protein
MFLCEGLKANELLAVDMRPPFVRREPMTWLLEHCSALQQDAVFVLTFLFRFRVALPQQG